VAKSTREIGRIELQPHDRFFRTAARYERLRRCLAGGESGAT